MKNEFPLELQPSDTIKVSISNAKSVELPRCAPTFPQWRGQKPAFSFGNKPFLNFLGSPVFAEIYILRLLNEAGWHGVWAEVYGGLCFLKDMPTHLPLRDFAVDIPKEKKSLFWSISAEANGHAGCFDVFAWKGSDILFCESKHHGKDSLRKTQEYWIKAALNSDISPDQLLIVEWKTM